MNTRTRCLFFCGLFSTFFIHCCSAQVEWNFNRIATFPVAANNGQRSNEPSAAEIVAASGDGMTLIYTDGLLKAVGRIDIRDPRQPKPLGLIDVGGEPTSVTVINNLAYVAVNTSPDFVNPSGKLLTIDLTTGQTMATCELVGQPDSTARNRAGTFIVLAIENERSESAGDGRVPQLPGGWVVKIPLRDGIPQADQMLKIDVTGLAAIAAEDPEPEFVDVNSKDEIVVTMQENNHIVIIDSNGKIAGHFSAGKVDLQNVDTVSDGTLAFDDIQSARLKEPDAVQWIDESHFVTCNEGDMDGGSRSITVFSKDGKVVFETNSEFETPIIQAGHYPEKRSSGKGVEPEGMEVGTFGDKKYVFALAERASTMSVYEVVAGGQLKFKQLLPTGLGPEGVFAIPERNLVIAASEVDLVKKGGVRADVMIYEYQPAKARYPEITSAGLGLKSGWGAISGMVSGTDGMIYLVNGGVYKTQSTIFTIDTRQSPARMIGSMIVKHNGKPISNLDVQGVTLDGQGGFWIASRGFAETAADSAASAKPAGDSNSRPAAIYNVSSTGDIRVAVSLPPGLIEPEASLGPAGITRVGDRLWIALERGSKVDPEGQAKLLAYDIKAKQWGAVSYPMHKPQNGEAVLSEIVAFGEFYYVVEGDNQFGEKAATKKIFRIAASQMVPQSLSGSLPLVSKEEVRDLLPDLKSTHGNVLEKVSAMAVFADGSTWLCTDNQGVTDTNAETRFWTIGVLK